MSRELEKNEHDGIAVGDTVSTKWGNPGPLPTRGVVTGIYRLAPTAPWRFSVNWENPTVGFMLTGQSDWAYRSYINKGPE